jgi:hypothetical protein
LRRYIQAKESRISSLEAALEKAWAKEKGIKMLLVRDCIWRSCLQTLGIKEILSSQIYFEKTHFSWHTTIDNYYYRTNKPKPNHRYRRDI